MRRSIALRVGSIALLTALVCVTSACAADAPSDLGNDDRAFDASDDAVITAVESTFASDNARAQWAGSTLRVTMDGSVEAPTASLPCLAIEALVAEGEDVTLVFSDGELICAERATAH